MGNSAGKKSPFLAKVNSVEPMEHGKWIDLRKIHYTDPTGTPRVWEMAVRTTRTETTNLDAVTILPLLKKGPSEKPSAIALVKQFRPPCGQVVIEMPAGLIDPNETIATTSERELLEETGYVGKATHTSDVVLFGDPGMTNSNHALTTIEIDMSNPQNQHPQAHPEAGEFIDVFTLPLDGLLKHLENECAKDKIGVDGRLYQFAYGLELAKHL